MNETIKNLIERRSCRKYSTTQIKEEELNSVLKAGEYAPTGMGRQSPIILVLQNKEKVEKLSKLNAKIMGTDKDPFYGAPTVLIVLADKNIGTYKEDGSLVLGNLMNAAYSIGLGSCWIQRGIRNRRRKRIVKRMEYTRKLCGHWTLRFRLSRRKK